MQIHELTQKQPVNEILGAIKNVVSAVGQPGGLKSLGSHLIPGAYSNIAAAQQGDFAKRMQSVQNTGLMKQAAANIQSQWEQYRQQVSPMTQIAPQQQAQQQKLKSQLLAKKVAGGPAASKLPLPGSSAAPAPTTPAATPATSTPVTVGKGQQPLDPNNSQDAALLARIQQAAAKQPGVTKESIQLAEAAGVTQLTDWYKQKVIPPSYTALAAEYLKNPTIQVALKKIATAETQPDAARQQAQTTGFQELMAATAVVSQQITAKNPQTTTATANSNGAARTVPIATGSRTARANLVKASGVSTAQLDAIVKITSALGTVTSSDPNTVLYLQALGFNAR